MLKPIDRKTVHIWINTAKPTLCHSWTTLCHTFIKCILKCCSLFPVEERERRNKWDGLEEYSPLASQPFFADKLSWNIKAADGIER